MSECLWTWSRPNCQSWPNIESFSEPHWRKTPCSRTSRSFSQSTWSYWSPETWQLHGSPRSPESRSRESCGPWTYVSRVFEVKVGLFFRFVVKLSCLSVRWVWVRKTSVCWWRSWWRTSGREVKNTAWMSTDRWLKVILLSVHEGKSDWW